VNLVAFPVLIPLLTAILLMALPVRQTLQLILSIGSGVLLLAVNLYMAVHVTAQSDAKALVLTLGGWRPEVGVTWVVDGLSALMLLLTAVISIAALLYAPGLLSKDTSRRTYFPLHQLLLVGVNGSFVTGDLFNLFVFFEIMLLTSFVQMTLSGGSAVLKKAVPYVLVNLAASMIFLFGVGLVYAGSGTVNFAVFSNLIALGPLPPVFWVGIALTLLVLAIKAGLAPVFFWLPDSYPKAPIPITALFAGLLTKVGVYALFRIVPLVSQPDSIVIQQILLPISIVTMIVGVLGALGSSEIRSILSFHIISQVGYMVLALGIYTKAALAAGIFYITHHMIVKTALFFAGGAAEVISGSERVNSKGGLALSHPFLALVFFLPAMALAGIPPLSGFWGKFLLVKSTFEAHSWIAGIFAVLVSFLTLASMLKIWNGMFWGGNESPNVESEQKVASGMYAAMFGLSSLSIAIGLFVNPLYDRAVLIANQISSPNSYIQSVLGSGESPSSQKYEVTKE